MKSRYAESFLFPNSQDDYRRPETFYPYQGLHGLDAVAPGYWEKAPDQKKWLEDWLAFYQQNLIALKNALANPGPWDTQAGTQNLIVDAENQIAYFKEQLRVDTSLPNFGETIAKEVAQLNAQSEAALTAASIAASAQNAADVFAQGGTEAEAQFLQKQADQLARDAAAQKALYDAAIASSTADISKQTFTDFALDTAAKQAAAAATGAAAYFADADIQNAIAKQAAAQRVITQQEAVKASQSGVKTMQDEIRVLGLDFDASGALLAYEDAMGQYTVIRGDTIDRFLNARGMTRANVQKTQAYVRGTTQTAAVDTSTGTVQHVDTASGTVSTGNSATGVVKVTTPTGNTVVGSGTVTAGGVTTTANPGTGTVTTTNNSTGVTTITSGSTGTTVQTVTAAAGGAGGVALIGLLGLLLLRGALK